MVHGKVNVRQTHFLYEAQRDIVIYIPVDAFCCDRKGHLFLELDVEYYYSIKEAKKIFGENIPALVPVSVLGDGLSQDDFIFHFDLVRGNYVIDVISKFESEEYQSAPELYLCIDDVETQHTKITEKKDLNFNQEFSLLKLYAQKRKFLREENYEMLQGIFKKIEKIKNLKNKKAG